MHNPGAPSPGGTVLGRSVLHNFTVHDTGNYCNSFSKIIQDVDTIIINFTLNIDESCSSLIYHIITSITYTSIIVN